DYLYGHARSAIRKACATRNPLVRRQSCRRRRTTEANGGRKRMNAILQDLRYALRQLRKNPGFTAACIVILALGIGSTTGMLAIVQSVLLRPLNYPGEDQLMLVG